MAPGWRHCFHASAAFSFCDCFEGGFTFSVLWRGRSPRFQCMAEYGSPSELLPVFLRMFDNMWYYERNNQQHGPVSQDELVNLFLMGEIGVDNLVWRQGYIDWVKLSASEEICAAIAAARPRQESYTPLQSAPAPAVSVKEPDVVDVLDNDSPPTPLQNLPQAVQQASATPQAVLSPLQTPAEVPLPPAVDFRSGNGDIAGLGIRFLAVLVDMILYLISFALFLYITREPVYRSTLTIIFTLADALMTSLWGGSPGKLLCGLRVIRSNGTPVGLLRSLGRACCKQFCGIGWFIAIVGDEHCALHDMLCDTRVVHHN